MNLTVRSLLLAPLACALALTSGCGHRAPKAEAANAPAAKPAQGERVQHDGKAGEVRGTPAPDSKFNQLRMGMSMKEVKKLIGTPTDEHSYITGKGFLWSIGSDTYRQEYLYKGLGRLTFASNGGFSTESHLIRIIHDANEKGTRS